MPLQKSFSDTNHSSKQRPQWSRNKTFGGPQASKTNPPTKPLQDKSIIPVSSTTKNKLNAFQFGGPKEDKPSVISLLSDDEKENSSSLGRGGKARSRKANSIGLDAQNISQGSVKNRGENSSERQDKPDLDGQSIWHQETESHEGKPAQESGTNNADESVVDENNKSSKPTAKSISKSSISGPSDRKDSLPSTPAARLSLPDLIGMEDVRRAVQDISPEDRIEWDRQPTDPSISSLTFGIRRAKKRARSSSPLSSPASQTTQVDPGSELWGRYSLNGSNAPTPLGNTIPALAHIMHTSSPQASREGSIPRTVAGFRRTTSCGAQFPKRRRVGGIVGDDVFTESVNIGPSKLAVLIERVQEGLAQPKTLKAGNGMSVSPVSEKTLSQQSDTLAIEPRTSSPIAAGRSTSLPKPTENQAPVQDQFNGSDYGDFDDDDLDDASITNSFTGKPETSATVESYLSKSKLPPDPPPQHHLLAAAPRPPAANTSKSTESRPLKVERDEFDDSDEDLLDDIVAKFGNKDSVDKAEPVQKGLTDGKPHRGFVVMSDSDDEFGDGDLDDLDFQVAEAAATQSLQQTSNSLLPSTQKVRTIQRYLVTNVIESEYKTASGRQQPEKILFLEMDQTKITKIVNLRGAWFETPVTKNAFVHVLGVFDPNGRCIIDDAENILILHPDHLISATAVGDSFGCLRRAVLQDRVKATGDASEAMLYGTILHEIFQAAMLANRWDTEWLIEQIKEIAARHMEDLYTIRKPMTLAVEYLQSKMGELQAWAELFVSSQPKPGAIAKAQNGETANMCVSKLLDVEEHVWSPMYGLKGNIDATVQVTMKDKKESRILTVPFEVKTGKNPSPAHRAQTALYNLLLSDRYDVEIAYGILYYMETSETIRIPTIRHELKHMIMKRNELACFVRERSDHLPPMLKKENMCNRCYAKVPCFIYHRLADDGTSETSGVKDKFDALVKHLTPNHKDFFLKWDDLLTKEESESLKFRRELWTMLSSEREKLSRCFSNVVIEPVSAYEDKNNSKINRYRYTLIKQDSPKDFSFLDSQIIVGEPIIISDEKGHYALAKGYATHVQKRRITVEVDRRLHNARIRGPNFDETDNQVFASIMEVAPEGAKGEDSACKVAGKPVQYRLDKDEFSNGMAVVRNNLIQVMAEGPFGSREIRSLVVDLNAPRFRTNATAYTLTDRENINVDQQQAISKVMSAQDYALVLGMPGTGKTTTIAHIIRALVSQGKSILLTSYTHSAVDNILLKLKDDAIPILRLGVPAKIHADVKEFAKLAATTRDSFEEIRSAWHDTPIVATTCLGINHAIFNERTFDYCIVDEASQITLPVCLGPIRMARTFILVGDHNQLPPLVQNKKALEGGLDISLFKLLSDAHPSSMVNLEHQYRMCEDVMSLSNNLIYGGRLKCGSQVVAESRISIPDIDALKHHHYSPSTISRSMRTICLGATRGQCWIRDLLDPDTKVSFINTDPLLPGSREENKGRLIVNHTEKAICTQLVESLISTGVPASSIGVMTHYRSQLSILKDGLKTHPGVEMHTADRFQGRDKEVIILSLVRSNEQGSIGELLKDWRRINVAFTRAKTKLLVIGSRETLKGNGPKADGCEEKVAQFVGLMEQKGWIYDLPSGALENHYFEDGATQITASGVSRPGNTQVKVEEVFKKTRLPSPQKGKGDAKRPLGENRENNGLRQPTKKICGSKPFKIPHMSVLNDITNDAMY